MSDERMKTALSDFAIPVEALDYEELEDTKVETPEAKRNSSQPPGSGLRTALTPDDIDRLQKRAVTWYEGGGNVEERLDWRVEWRDRRSGDKKSA